MISIRIHGRKLTLWRVIRWSLGGVKRVFTYALRKPSFKEYHFNDEIISPIMITPNCIVMEKDVHVGFYARIEGVEIWNNKRFNPVIIFKKGVTVQQNLHLTCANYISIGRNTAIAANVTITDIHHPYIDIDIPIEHQMIEVKEVVIGEECKLYNNVVVLPGVHIGKHTTIGANSVVCHDIPDYSVAVGNPARIIRQYDFENKKWIKTY